MTCISCENIILSFGSDTVLDKLSFSLNDGDKLGIVGVNGAGKTTLFRIITGEYTPDSGNIYIAKDKTVGLLTQENSFNENNTVLDEMMLAKSDLIKREQELELIHRELENGNAALASRYAVLHDAFTRDGGYEYRGRVKGTLKHLGFDENMWTLSVSSLSGGQKTRLALVRLILKDPDIMMLDEPTNHLDMESIEWLEDYLRNYKKTVMLISHDRYFLDRTVNRILEIENKHGKLYKGNYSAFTEIKKNDREIQERHYKNQQREIARLEAYIEQQRRWNRERNIIAAESRQKLLDKMERVERPENLPQSIKLTFGCSGDCGNDILSVKKLSKSYGEKILFKDVSFDVKKNEHVFVCGPNGCGKSTLIKIISERLPADSGRHELGYNVKVGYYDQENQDLHEENTVLEELWNAYENKGQTELRNALARFLFRGDDINKKVSVLSGGEKARLTLCRLILSKMNFLILDEPTNHLDINSREALESALLEFDGTILAVSHDRYFLSKLATRILNFENGGVFDFKGTYSEFRDYKNRQNTLSQTESEEHIMTTSKESYLQSKKDQSEIRRFERKLRLTKEDIEKTEKAIEETDIQIEKAATDYVRSAELWTKKEELEAHLLELYEMLDEFEKK